jgi:hypothetical protein
MKMNRSLVFRSYRAAAGVPPSSTPCATRSLRLKSRSLLLELALLLALLAFCGSQVQATSIASLELGTASQSGNSTGASTFTSKDANISSLPALSLTAGQQGQAGGTGYVSSKAWNVTSEDLTKYWEFTLTAASGFNISVTSVTLRMRRSGTGPPSINLRSSVDGYGADIGGTQNLSSADTYTTIAFTGLTLSSSSITFRVYAWGATGSGGTLRIGDGADSSLDIDVQGAVMSTTPLVTIDNTGTPAAGPVVRGTSDAVLFGFMLTPSTSLNFTGLKLTTAGTATSSDLSNFRVVYDADNSGTYDGGESVVSGSQSLANPINFTSISGQTGFSDARRYLVIADVAGGATDWRTFTASIASSSDVTCSASTSGTAAGNQQTITANDMTIASAYGESPTISSLVNDAAITTTSQGAQVWQVTFNNLLGNSGAGTISGLIFRQGANNVVTNWPARIQAAELFDGSSALGAGTVSDASIAFSGLSVEVPDGGSKTLALRISLKNTAGALPDNLGFQFALAPGDVTVSGNSVIAAAISSDQSQNVISVVATRLAFTTVPAWVVTNTAFSVTVQAEDANGNRDHDDLSTVTIGLDTGVGVLSGGGSFSLSSGIKTWSGLAYDTLGGFTLRVSAPPLTDGISPLITARVAPTLTEVFLPQYIQGIPSGSSNTKRVPFAYRVSLSNLFVNATYRYYNQCVISSDGATTAGAGNCIFPTASGNFVRTTGPAFSSEGNCGTFTTDANGAYTGWFVTEPTGNARFATNGNQIFMRIMLNDGADGTSVAMRVTTPDFATVLPFGTDTSTGTGIHGNSSATDKNFVLLYGNTAGTGRPLAATFVESDGAAENTDANYVKFYNDSVDGISGAWGAIIPNNNANGVQRIEQRGLSDGSLVEADTDSDGEWPSGANTRNPTGGDATPIVIAASDAPLGIKITQIQVTTGGDVLIDFSSRTSDTATDFTVWSASSLPTLTLIVPTPPITTLGPGQFRATVSVVTPAAFYRIKR